MRHYFDPPVDRNVRICAHPNGTHSIIKMYVDHTTKTLEVRALVNGSWKRTGFDTCLMLGLYGHEVKP